VNLRLAVLPRSREARSDADLSETWNLVGRSERNRGVRIFLVAVCVAAIAAPAAFAKGRITVRVADPTPRVGQAFTVELHTGWVVPANDWLRLIAVAPGKDWYDVVGTVTGDSSLAHANVPYDGFEIKLKRVAPKIWSAVVRLPRPGRWRLVVPNGTHEGFMVPPPAQWMPWVAVHR
jgi:hypothetical protein